MQKYHVGENGPGLCKAEVKTCPLKASDGSSAKHYETQELAQKAFTRNLETEFGEFSTMQKASNDSFRKDAVKPLTMDYNGHTYDAFDDSKWSTTIPSEPLDTSYGDEHVVEYYTKVYEYFKDVPRIESRTRVIYYFDDHVIKVPLTDEGEFANSSEIAPSKRGEFPIASSTYEKVEIAGETFEVMKMERVTPLKVNYQTMPDWVDMVDCGQVGIDKSGELVAYDL